MSHPTVPVPVPILLLSMFPIAFSSTPRPRRCSGIKQGPYVTPLRRDIETDRQTEKETETQRKRERVRESRSSGVDVNSEVPERSRKNLEMTLLMISRKFLVSSPRNTERPFLARYK